MRRGARRSSLPAWSRGNLSRTAPIAVKQALVTKFNHESQSQVGDRGVGLTGPRDQSEPPTPRHKNRPRRRSRSSSAKRNQRADWHSPHDDETQKTVDAPPVDKIPAPIVQPCGRTALVHGAGRRRPPTRAVHGFSVCCACPPFWASGGLSPARRGANEPRDYFTLPSPEWRFSTLPQPWFRAVALE